ncbi:recombinase family protein, partial [Kordia jejudonensis]|uniref:recombinase family protein n=1 Tax=Kordia jejudonensis TaxID=1348245 RepID=UPI0006292E18
MRSLNQFQHFVKRSKKQTIRNNKAVIYTRVASQIQNENSKIQYQKKLCLHKAEQLQLNVKKCFGGTCKSGFETQTDIETMISYVEKYDISNIIVYTYDRLTRKNGYATIEKFKSLGIQIITVVQPKIFAINLSKLYR